MGSLSSTSTIAQIAAQFRDNACYAADGSVAKCKLFMEACLHLQERRPEREGGENWLVADRDYLALYDRAEKWLERFAPASDASRSSNPHVTRVGFNDVRRY